MKRLAQHFKPINMKLDEFKDFTVLKEHYLAYRFNDQARTRLAEIFPPKYSEFVGHHVTVAFNVKSVEDLISNVPTIGKIVGHADNGIGLEALVVEVNGTTQRPDGKIYHITWSLDRQKGFRPSQSNELVKQGWESVDPIEIQLIPEILKK